MHRFTVLFAILSLVLFTSTAMAQEMVVDSTTGAIHTLKEAKAELEAELASMVSSKSSLESAVEGTIGACKATKTNYLSSGEAMLLAQGGLQSLEEAATNETVAEIIAQQIEIARAEVSTHEAEMSNYIDEAREIEHEQTTLQSQIPDIQSEIDTLEAAIGQIEAAIDKLEKEQEPTEADWYDNYGLSRRPPRTPVRRATPVETAVASRGLVGGIYAPTPAPPKVEVPNEIKVCLSPTTVLDDDGQMYDPFVVGTSPKDPVPSR